MYAMGSALPYVPYKPARMCAFPFVQDCLCSIPEIRYDEQMLAADVLPASSTL